MVILGRGAVSCVRGTPVKGQATSGAVCLRTLQDLTGGLFLGTYDDPRGVGVSYERDHPVSYERGTSVITVCFRTWQAPEVVFVDPVPVHPHVYRYPAPCTLHPNPAPCNLP